MGVVKNGPSLSLLSGVVVFLFFLVCSVNFTGNSASITISQLAIAEETTDLDIELDDEFEEENELEILDPLEPMNRFFFHFNDKLYFWALKPAGKVYSAVVPKDFRICIRNFFHNLMAPIRVVNNVLQGKFKNAGVELSRFAINTTAGIAGFADPAKTEFGLEAKNEDFGQTLGFYGIGNGIYFCWPIFGPSTARDTVGLAGDYFLNPLTYLMNEDSEAGIAAYTVMAVNNTSLVIGAYEAFLESSFDPYISLRDAYIQHRDSKVKDKNENEKIY